MYAYVWDSNGQVDVFGLEIITVYRFDTRSPDVIKSGGGFQAFKPGADVDLLDYAKHNTKSQFISTSYSLESARDFGRNYYNSEGYIYKIEIDDAKGIDVNKTLGADSPFPKENEFAVINRILNEDIKGTTHAKNITDVDNIKWNYY
ncbi:enterotoxin A family protein [Myroides sp. DF42-4-2]|uniref:scabin-related ADP-ribosyltransferase n=1 Tax=Myroides sp. DF42-4-2 TaxID=2746726 RepID=UPI002578F6F2|nr:enterotoxin A family protein [Myroides sp. DF42-4-2]MDM1409039.1 hypothetical protein [Myroides sp. DF42-4-2]